jgi:dTDP-glucose 4,6-dehydratase
VDVVIARGTPGEVYNIGGGNEVRNVDLTRSLLRLAGRSESLIKNVRDRQGHDLRYSLDNTKLRKLGWEPQVTFEEGLKETVNWYRENEWWWRPIKEQDPAFRAFYQAQYGP